MSASPEEQIAALARESDLAWQAVEQYFLSRRAYENKVSLCSTLDEVLESETVAFYQRTDTADAEGLDKDTEHA